AAIQLSTKCQHSAGMRRQLIKCNLADTCVPKCNLGTRKCTTLSREQVRYTNSFQQGRDVTIAAEDANNFKRSRLWIVNDQIRVYRPKANRFRSKVRASVTDLRISSLWRIEPISHCPEDLLRWDQNFYDAKDGGLTRVHFTGCSSQNLTNALFGIHRGLSRPLRRRITRASRSTA